jgi:hypothetical protein
MLRRGTVCVAIVVAMVIPPAPIQAAWAVCDVMLVGEAVVTKTDVDGKRLALLNWTERAKQIDIAYARWQLAWNRKLACEPQVDGQFRCQATAMPCRISQTPPPRGSEILRPGKAP